MRRKACEGEQTVTEWTASGDMEECLDCGRRVRWDLSDHPFFGFKASCSKIKSETKPE